MKLLGFWLCGLLFVTQSVVAQHLSIADFKQVKKLFLVRTDVATDKQKAWFELRTAEKGFTFLADGKQPVKAIEEEGKLILLLPHKTRFILVKHADYGDYYWKSPHQYLKKKKHYEATLISTLADSEYQLSSQWLKLDVAPCNAIVWIDSLYRQVNDGFAHFLLPIGRHQYRVEAPFYQMEEGEVELTDSATTRLSVRLQPCYAYLSVKTPLPQLDIWLDGQIIGKGSVTTPRLMAGVHELRLYCDNNCWFGQYIELNASEKKAVDVGIEDINDYRQREMRKGLELTADTMGQQPPAVIAERAPQTTAANLCFAPVTLKVNDAKAEILINRESVGKGYWKGTLPEGQYALQTRKDGVESAIVWKEILDSLNCEVNLPLPGTNRGFLNVFCNEPDAQIWLNGNRMGTTPCILSDLPTLHPVELKVRKQGFEEEMHIVKLNPNALVEIKVTLKKRRDK